MKMGADYMDRNITRTCAWEHFGAVVLAGGLQLTEQVNTGIWNFQFNKMEELNAYCKFRLSSQLEPGESLFFEETTCLRYSPIGLYFVFDENQPPEVGEFSKNLTDISHGKCRFKLAGEQAFAFVCDYAAMDLNQGQVQKFKMAKTLIGDYPILLYWQHKSEINLMVDRSYAQSFAGFLSVIASYWQT